MADVRASNARINAVLTGFAVGWGTQNFVGPLLAPRVTVANKSDYYPVYSEEIFRLHNDALGENAEAWEIDFPVSRDQYYCNGHALRRFLADETWQNARDQGTRRMLSQRQRVASVKTVVWRNYEKTVLTALSTATNYATALRYDGDVSGNLNDGGVNSLQVMLAQQELVSDRIGTPPDTAIIASDVWQYLATDADLLPTLTGSVMTAQAALANLLGVQRVIVPRSTYSTAKKGQTQNRTKFWPAGTIAFITTGMGGSTLEVDPANEEQNLDLELPRTAVTFQWNAGPGAAEGEAVRTYRNEERGFTGGEFVQYGFYYDVKLTGVDSTGKIISGSIITNALQ